MAAIKWIFWSYLYWLAAANKKIEARLVSKIFDKAYFNLMFE
jgi:hypothetical protein